MGGGQGKGNFPSLLVGQQTGTATMEISGGKSPKLRINLPHDSAIFLLGRCPKDVTSYSTVHASSAMSIAALLTTARKWKQPKRPVTEAGRMKMWSIRTMECSPAVRESEIMNFHR